VVGALLPSWWLNGRAAPSRIEHLAQTTAHWQQRNAAARTSHIKRTRRKLREIGIHLKNLIPCKWP